MKTTVEYMRDFTTLTKEDKLQEAADFVAGLSDDVLSGFTRQTLVKSIEILKCPDNTFETRALVNTEYISANKPVLLKMLLSVKENYLEENGVPEKSTAPVVEEKVEEEVETVEPPVEAPKEEPEKKTRKKRKLKLSSMEDVGSEELKAPKVEEAVEAAKATGADAVEVAEAPKEEAPESKFEYVSSEVSQTCDNEELLSKHNEILYLLDTQSVHLVNLNKEVKQNTDNMKALVGGINTYSENMVNAHNRLYNATKAIALRIDEVWHAICTLGTWSLSTDLDTTIKSFSTGKEAIKKMVMGDVE